ncbi:PPR containing plant-like protein [Medicago truncatula]|uniref:PPR containing plant-like protein n=2 Tax=Medicago truncatula TaxID=3880 RepID=G7L5Q9_MEDTR|nr:PPR containing plant-like protein [Medicago truncatula]
MLSLLQLCIVLVHHSLHHQNHWVVLLLTQCTRFLAPSSYTCHIFHAATHPDVRVFTFMLKYYSQIGVHSQVFVSLFKHMLQHCDIKPNASFYSVMMKSAGSESMLFLAHVLKSGYDRDHYVRNGILGIYAKYGPIEFARKLFDEMPDRTVADWNVMISGYWKCGNEEEASTLFHVMGDQEISRNVITWTTMITGHAKKGNLKTARMYFDKMPERSVVSWNAMLSGYAQGGAPEETIRLFNDMLSPGNVQPDETTWATVISSCSSLGDPCLSESIVRKLDDKVGFRPNYFVKTALLDMHAKCGNLEAAHKIFEQLGVYKYRSSVPWNAMISAYARVGDLPSAKHLFDKMPQRDTVSWNSMIAGYTQNGESFKAIKLFEEMISSEDSRKPDEVTMVSVFSACGHLGELGLGNWAVSILKVNHIQISISVYNSLINMYSRCGSMQDAVLIFQEMATRDLVSYNTLISGFAEHGHGMESIELLSKMKEDGIEPDRITYIAILTACSHAGLLDEGQRLFESIKFPDVDHYACMIDMLGRAGRLEEAMKLIQSMPMEPHAGIYGSLLNATSIHKQVELGELAAAKLFKVEPHNSGNYALLSNIYASAGRWKEGDKVRDTMRKQGVKKTTGLSWLEHNS